MSNQTKLKSDSCPICGGSNVRTFIKIKNMPVHCCLLWPDKDEAIQTDRGDIELAYCQNCSHIYNKSFDPMKINYSGHYENALYFSDTFQDYAQKLAAYLVKKYQIQNKDVIDIGCGQGYFLSMLCKMGNNRGYGFDPGFRIKDQDLKHTGNVKFIRDYYSAKYSAYKADLIICRQVLEHINDPVEFLNTVRMALRDNQSVVFFEVPNAEYMLDTFSVWDIIYEHHSYFSKKSLKMLLSQNCFKVSRIDEIFDRQYLGVEARPLDDVLDCEGQTEGNGLDSKIDSFEKLFKIKVEKWEDMLKEWSLKNEKTVLWGAGSKGMTFLNILRNSDSIEFIVDVNPRKQNKFLNGSGQKIIAPDFIRDYKPAHIILMNPIYKEEITNMIHSYDIDSSVVLV